MSRQVRFDRSKAMAFIQEHEFENFKATAEAAVQTLRDRSGAGNDYLGWLDLPLAYDKEEFGRIKKAAAKIQGDSDVLVVIGIGGSYLGARAAIEFLRHGFYNNIPKEQRGTPEIYFAGNSLSPS
nr:glucose-6-phosphate isomerase [Clostridia bacterium]